MWAAVTAVLDDPTYRHNAQRLRAELDALPALDQALQLLEVLAATQQPLFSPSGHPPLA